MNDFEKRLRRFLETRDEAKDFIILNADASTREYFRVTWQDGTAVACVYPHGSELEEQTYLDVTELFIAAGLPVAQIFDFDDKLDLVIQEDLGDRILRDDLELCEDIRRSGLLNEAISIIAQIQAATPLAYERNSIASRLKFDTEKLLWELNYFKTHYFETYRIKRLSADDEGRMTSDFMELAAELDSFATTLCHRDFHTANLMLDSNDRMRIIDHQDARMGSAAYDLVSLLLDRITEIPSAEWLAEKRGYFLGEREKLGLDKIDELSFEYEFHLQTIQRCLKAAGTFSYQSTKRGKTYFVPFIMPMLRASLRAAEELDKFPALQPILRREIDRI